jgi:adenylate cyclase
VAALLNGYLTTMTRIVFRHRGTLDKYMGDALMAFWGAPFEEPGHAEKACNAALAMLAGLDALRHHWQAQGKPLLDIGLGIHTGTAAVGNMGSALRYGYTALGDAVNLASRLERLNKVYGTHILASESSYRAAPSDRFLFRELDLIRVEGKLQPVTIYELLGSSDTPDQMRERAEVFRLGREFYKRRDWQQARSCFQQLLARWADDGPARVFLARCEEYLLEQPAPDWDGVYVFRQK